MRQFEDSPAVRKQVPLLIGLVGPSGGGKTYSALRLATGIQGVTGGDIYYIDTEANRALHYADRFKFRHLPFGAPFSPLDYLDAIEHCVKKGAKTVVIDSMSHEHEGPGGVLETHETELQRIGKGDAGNFLAWAKPKGDRRRLINSMLQMNVNFISCFRAKEKIKLKTGEKPTNQGWQPIAGEEYVFEQTLNCLLLPNAGGIPTWNPEEKAERQMIKLPEQFKALLGTGPLSEDIGRKLAEWAKGGAAAPAPAPQPMPKDGSQAEAAKKGLRLATTLEQLGEVWTSVWKAKTTFSDAEMAELTAVKDDMKTRLTAVPAAAPAETLL